MRVLNSLLGVLHPSNVAKLEMGASYTPQLIKILIQAGCVEVRKGKGDHVIWYSPLTETHFPVDSKILSRHTANGVLKQAGLPKQF